MTDTNLAKQAAKHIQSVLPGFKPQYAIVLGSGLADIAEHIENRITIPYADLPGLDECSVAGHAGLLHLGNLAGKPCICLEGRLHFYEGDKRTALQTLIFSLKYCGVEIMISTSASGSMDAAIKPGQLFLIKDHINLQGTNPLIACDSSEFGSRFIDMEHAYDPALNQQLLEYADELNLTMSSGTYIATLGPTFETPAEIRAFRTMGADAVGMSLVPEVILAHYCGIRLAAVSVITNYAAGLSDARLSHELTLSTAKQGADDLYQLIHCLIENN